jgi:dihydrofolate reductase
MKIALIAAKASNQSIGLNGRLPWYLPGDMAWFKAKTMGKPCIMGRKTWDSLPRKPLAGRTNIVVTRNAGAELPGGIAARSFDEALGMAETVLGDGDAAEEVMVIGGATLYAEALPRAHRIYLTDITVPFPGDVFFPLFNQRRWKVAFEERHLDLNPPHVFYVLDKKG